MKNLYEILLSLLLSLYGIGLIAQNLSTENSPLKVSSKEWDQMKSSGKSMNNVTMYDAIAPHQVIHPVIHRSKNIQSISCNGFLPLDSTFEVAPFTIGGPSDYRNDDGSTVMMNLPFTFCFYGNNYTSVYINNNGNISFGSPYGTYSPVGLQGAAQKMVAAFWSDADTRNALSGIVYYKVTPTALIVRWDSIGYYALHVDKVNDFQVIITNGLDSLAPGGNNVRLSYGMMQWTTGDASSGNNGFVDTVMNSGSPGAVGATNADNSNYIQFGLFGRPGSSYNGPNSPFPYSGVSWLNNKTFVFSTCGASNIPPVVNWLSTCDTIHICVGDTLNIPVSFLSPEFNQITTDTAICNMNGFSIINQTSGNVASVTAQVAASILNIGNHTINFSGTDNGFPPATANFPVTICVDTSCGCSAQFTLTPDSATQHLYWIVNLASGAQPLHYSWSWGDATYDSIPYPNHIYANAGIYSICLTITDASGCSSTHCSSFNLQRIDNTMIYVNVRPPNFTTNIKENKTISACSLFPNPNNGNFTLSYQLLTPTALFQIQDITGRIIYQQNISGIEGTKPIDVSKLSKGIYYWELITGYSVSTKGKFVVIR